MSRTRLARWRPFQSFAISCPTSKKFHTFNNIVYNKNRTECDIWLGFGCFLQCILALFQFSGRAARAWCSMYECRPNGPIWVPILFVLAALLFSPWTLMDGLIGATAAQVSGLFTFKHSWHVTGNKENKKTINVFSNQSKISWMNRVETCQIKEY